MTKEQKQQFTLRITQANETQMILILYEMLLCYLEEIKDAISMQDKIVLQEAVRKARACINELIHSLNLKYEPAPNLLKLYYYCLRKLVHIERKQNKQAVSEIEAVILPLCQAYQELAKQNKKGPIMKNTQTVYTGLTYGRNQLTKDVTDQGTNRGMFA